MDDVSSHSVPSPCHPGSIDLLDAEKTQALATSLATQFQPVNDPSEPYVIENFGEALRAYFTLASEPHLTNPAEIQDAIRVLRVDKTPGPNGLPNTALQQHHPQRTISLVVKIFNAYVHSRYFASTWKRARVTSILKPGNDLAHLSYFKPISPFDTTDKYEDMLLARILSGVSMSYCATSSLGLGPSTACLCSWPASWKVTRDLAISGCQARYS